MTDREVPHTPSRRPLSIPATPLHVDIDLTATEAAWKKHEARARALVAGDVSLARIDVTQAAAIALAGAENVLGERERIVAIFKTPELDVIERVREVALAAQHADLLHRAAQDEESSFADVLPRMNELRALFLGDMELIRKRQPKLLDQKTLDDIRKGDNSVRDKANDLNDCANWYATHRKDIQRTTIAAEEITEASALATRALARLGKVLVARTPKEGELSSGELRRRAFTLLAQDYDVVRRYGAFLFWHLPGGWEQFVPSLWSGRANGPSATAEGAEEPAAPANPTPPAKPE